MTTLTFTVDAALLRELGQRLIGQRHIALAELVKNSYDADASTCRITFRAGEIEIADDGKGMSFQEFRDFWMRIGTTHKVEQRTSAKLGRPLTGSKGVGRLAVQFLADEMTIETTPENKTKEMLVAVVDWRVAERGKEISSVPVDVELTPNKPGYPNGSAHGTRIVLTQLKDTWGTGELEQLGREIWMLRSPFRQRGSRSASRAPEDFDVEVEAPDIAEARAAFDDVVTRLFANWRARIRGRLDNGRFGAKANITVDFANDGPDMEEESFRERVQIPIRKATREPDTPTEPLLDRVNFEILIFKIEGRQVGGVHVGDLREYLQKYGNVSIYDTGFRLPYYGTGHDWLDISLDQSRRISISELLPPRLRIDQRYMLDLPNPTRIFGAVEIDTGHERALIEGAKARPGEWLQIQPGRDRLHENEAFAQLHDLVRYALDFYANRYRMREARAAERHVASEPATAKQERALRILDRNKDAIPAQVFREVKHEVTEALKAAKADEAALDKRAALLAPLASAGMAALALNHELARETRFLGKAASELRRLARNKKIPELTDIANQFEEASGRLEALQELFGPLLTEMDKGANERLRVHPVVEQTATAMRTLMPGVEFQLKGIPASLRFPVGSLAEWNALLQNVLSNAWNAMLGSPTSKVGFKGGQGPRKREWLRISDSGRGLGRPLDEAARLFEPFERGLEIDPDHKSIALGGQGLGLAIVRMIARRRRADVAFVEPEEGFSTTIELSWKG